MRGSARNASGLMALAMSRARTAAGCSLNWGSASISKAATPATDGDDMLVPLDSA